MAKCKYIITLPGGGSVELPASFGTIDKSKDIDKLFSSYSTEIDNDKKQEKLKELYSVLRSKVPEDLHGNTINKIIKSSDDIDNLYKQLNDAIKSFGTYDNIGQALKNFIYEGTKKKGEPNKNLQKLKTALEKERGKTYFKDAGLMGVLGATNLAQERNRMFTKNLQNQENGFPTEITQSLVTFLNSLIHKYPDTKTNSILYGAKLPFSGKAWSDDEIVLYDLNDDLSLFLGLFKREAVKLDPVALRPILEEINKIVKFKKYGNINLDNFDINTFFKGTIEKNKVIVSQFEELLNKATDKDIAKQIDAIFNLMANTLNPKNTTLAKSLKTLFWLLNPNNYGKNNLMKELEGIKFREDELTIETEYKNKLLSFTEMESTQRNLHFSPSITIEENSVDAVIHNIALHKDIVKFPVGKLGLYALVTGIFTRPNGKVAIYGIYKNQFDELETISDEFSPLDVIYKKRETIQAPYDQNEIITPVQGLLIASSKDMEAPLIKQLIRKGDLVNGKTVVGIYPGYLRLRTPSGDLEYNFYQHIKSFTSAKALEDIEVENAIKPGAFEQIQDGNDLTAGDYFLFKGKKGESYKKILYIDKTNVFSLVTGSKNEMVIKGTPKEGLVGLRNALGELSSNEIKTINQEFMNVGRSAATMSSFTNPASARKGDFFYIDGKKGKQGKVLNDGKVIIYNSLTNREVTSLDNLPPVTFFTNRDISTKYALFTVRANQLAISIKPESEKEPLDVEMRYVVPVGTDLDKLVMLHNGYATIGSYKEAAFINAETEIDITEKMKEILTKSKDFNFYGKKESSTNNKFERNLTSLTRITGFEKLDLETRKNLNIIAPGTYFSLFRGNDIDRNIYRVLKVSDDVVTVQMNKLSNTGTFITTEMDLSLEHLLSLKTGDLAPEGSIGRLYIMDGNNKMGTILKEISKVSSSEPDSRKATNKAINKLTRQLKAYTKGLNIEIRVVPHDGNFNIGEKAKIMTDENGKTSILVSDTIGQTEDLVHEFLHLFLTPLRYKYPEVYNELIASIVKDPTLNIVDAEEEFVKYVSSKMELQENFIENFEDLDTFVKGIQTILVDIDTNFAISKEDNPMTLLNTPLMDLFGINKDDNSNPMFNLGMITTEPMMREWMKENNIILNCI